jgi:hypothetical protein
VHEAIEVGVGEFGCVELVVEVHVLRHLLAQLSDLGCWVWCHTAMLSLGSVGTFSPVNVELWLFRALWLVLPFTAGPSFAAALDDADELLQTGVSTLLWAIWAATLVALMVPRTQTLTALRVVAPSGLVAVGMAIFSLRDQDSIAFDLTMAIITVGWAAVMAFRPTISDSFVDGSSYGDETRFLLSTPGPLMAGPIQLVWLAIAVGALAGPVALLDERWVLGGILLVLGWPLAFFAVPILHRLSNRWLVFVPAGMVVHDKTALREPQLFRVSDIAGLGPAPVDTDVEDISLGGLGLALRVALKEPSKIIRNERSSSVDLTEIDGFVVSPNRPGAVVAEAKERGYPIA